jgi:hypothetical protein
MKRILQVVSLSPGLLSCAMVWVLAPGSKVVMRIKLDDAASLPILGNVDFVGDEPGHRLSDLEHSPRELLELCRMLVEKP